MPEMIPEKPKRVQARPDVLAVSLPLATRAELLRLAAELDIPVSHLVVAWIELGDIHVSAEKLRRFAALPLDVAPAAVRSTVAKMQAAA